MSEVQAGSDQRSGPKRSHCRLLLHIIWYLIAVITIFLLVERGWFSLRAPLKPDEWGSAAVIVYLISLYTLFLSEGVNHSATQLHKTDRDGIYETIRRDKNYSQKRTESLIRFLTFTLDRFESFLIGRQIISLSAVALLAIAIERSPKVHDELIYSEASKVAAWGFTFASDLLPASLKSTVDSAHIHTSSFFSSLFGGEFFSTFLLSALFPCWISQIFPGLLATKGSVRFFTFPGAKPCASAAVLIGQLGAGLPGQFFYNNLVRLKLLGFDNDEHIGIGDASTYSHLRTALGECITSRKVILKIADTGVTVADTFVLERLAPPSSRICPTLRVALPHCAANEIKVHDSHLVQPDGIKAKVSTRAAQVIVADYSITPVSPKQAAELLILAKCTLENAIPRDLTDSETLEVTFNYHCPPFSTDDSVIDLFCIDVTKATRLIEIILEFDDGLFCEEPTVAMRGIDELMLQRLNSDYETERTAIERIGANQRRITIKYPPMGTRYVLSINVVPCERTDLTASNVTL
ncbi:hypothetical protein ACTZWT_15680 [Rhodopseudomonas sp. NSM]|uniref:hypothetical protein n=1 Tax=Rhodopseudomonas sp. NSM TaxID=3457630 RepID=UPI004035B8CC